LFKFILTAFRQEFQIICQFSNGDFLALNAKGIHAILTLD